MISIEEVLRIHDILIEKFGGTPGVRDKELLESFIFRPFNTFDSVDLYPASIDTPWTKSIRENDNIIDL